MKKILTALLISAQTLILSAQSIETSGFSPSEIRPDDTSVYTVILKDISGNIDGSSIPMPDGLQIIAQSRSQSFSMTNGTTSSSTSIAYTVKAEREGTFTVPVWEVNYKGKILKVSQATLKVDKNAPAQQTQSTMQMQMPFGFGAMGLGSGRAQAMAQAQAAAKRQQQEIDSTLENSTKLEIKLPREKIYVGESVPCELIFYFDKSLLERGVGLTQLVPEIKKADAFDCPAFTAEPVVDKTSNPDSVIIRFNTVITPLKVGTYDLDFSAHVRFSRNMSMDDFMGMAFASSMSMLSPFQIQKEIQMPAKKIEVSALPIDGKPQNFTGAIGKFSLEEVTIDPDVLSVGDPAIIQAKIVGMGNFGRISAPELKTENSWKTYKPKTSFADESNGEGYIGIKTFEYTVVPSKPDLKIAPQVLFNYFDPNAQKYVEITSKEIPVSVAPTGRSKRAQDRKQVEESKSAEPTFAQILDKPEASSTGANLLTSPLFWALQLTILALIVLFVLRRKNTIRLESDPAYAKEINYRKTVKRYLKSADTAAERNDAKAFFMNARSAIQYALTAKSELEASALILREARDLMRELSIDEVLIEGIGDFFDGADALIFGGLDSSKLNLNELNQRLQKVCREIEK